MLRSISAIAVVVLAATPALALDAKEAKDARAIQQNAAQAKRDQDQANALMKHAAQLENESAAELKRANELWIEWSKLHQNATQKRAQARSDRFAASKLNAAAGRLLQSEQLRADALHDRQAADVLHKSAWTHLLKAQAAQTAVSEANKALGDLKNNPAFADAIKAIQADVARNQAIIGPEQQAAKNDESAASVLIAEATKKETQADQVGKPVAPPPPKPPPPPPPPKAVVVVTPPVKVAAAPAVVWGFVQLDGTDFVLDIDQRKGKSVAGSPVTLWHKKKEKNSNQLWTLTADGFLMSAEGGLVLDIDQRTAGGKAGASVIVWTQKPTNNTNQKWTLSNGVVQNQGGDLVLDVDQRKGKTGESSPVIVWGKKSIDNANQRFKLVPQ